MAEVLIKGEDSEEEAMAEIKEEVLADSRIRFFIKILVINFKLSLNVIIVDVIYGHIKAFCWNQTRNQANYLENKPVKDEGTSSEALFLTCLSSTDNYDEIWFLDSGCSNHMTRNKSLFVSLDESRKSEVKMGG